MNRRYSGGGAVVVSATEWQADPATLAWARQQGHHARLSEEGLRAADAKWRAHRAGFPPRPVAAWAADWRAWITREHGPGSTNRSAGPAATGGMTRAQAHTAALLAALDDPTGRE